MAAKITTPQQITKILFVQIFLPHNEGANPLTTLQPSVLIIGTAHQTTTPTGTAYTYELAKVQAQGIGPGRNFLNEMREPLLAHIEYLFEYKTPPIPGYPEGGRENPNQGPEIYNEVAKIDKKHFENLQNFKQGDKVVLTSTARQPLPNNYLTSEDYQYDRGEELREQKADPTNL